MSNQSLLQALRDHGILCYTLHFKVYAWGAGEYEEVTNYTPDQLNEWLGYDLIED